MRAGDPGKVGGFAQEQAKKSVWSLRLHLIEVHTRVVFFSTAKRGPQPPPACSVIRLSAPTACNEPLPFLKPCAQRKLVVRRLRSMSYYWYIRR